jgi:hypothetical protein
MSWTASWWHQEAEAAEVHANHQHKKGKTMNKQLTTICLATVVLAALFQPAAKGEDPVNPVPGAVCNLYLLPVYTDETPNSFLELAATLSEQPAHATFADRAMNFKDVAKKDNIDSNVGMWTGWFQVENAGTYTFQCKRGGVGDRIEGYRYGIWINGEKCVEGKMKQNTFNVELHSGFNSVRIVLESFYPTRGHEECSYPLSITYKKAGSVKDAVPFGPGDMWYDDEE